MAKKKNVPKKLLPPVAKAREPEYMVQLSDPKMVRKDLLESLREIIIFMQGYEKFRKVQEEKIKIFHALKNDVKELSNIVEFKLKRRLPKGKLRPVTGEGPMPSLPETEEEKPEVPVERRTAPVKAKPMPNDLDELEAQLQDIEGQLRRV